MSKSSRDLSWCPWRAPASYRDGARQRGSLRLRCCTQHSSVLEELKRLGVRPKKSLGQNFLTSETVLSDIVRAASLRPGDSILEIGPGLGTLTGRLVNDGARVLAIEKDDVFAKHLEQKFALVQHICHRPFHICCMPHAEH